MSDGEPALALTPYVAAFGVVLGCACLMVRRCRVAGAVFVLTIVLAATLLPRMLANDQPPASGTTSEGGGGAGVVSSYTVTRRASSADAGVAATLALPGSTELDVVAVHTLEPVRGPAERWRANLASLPGAGGTGDAKTRILAGDFNATLDHVALRELLDAGYVDAAAQVGAGMYPTWPDAMLPPPVTIDHLLVGQLSAVRDYATFDIAGTDHHAVYAEITLPTGTHGAHAGIRR